MLISAPHVSHTLNYSAEKPAAEREERRREEKRRDVRAPLVFCSRPLPSFHSSALSPLGTGPGWEVEGLTLPVGDQIM